MARRRRKRPRVGSRSVALGVLAVVLAVSPMLMAGTTAPTAVAIAILAPLAALAAHLAYAQYAPAVRQPAITAALIVAGVVALQAVPLPIELVAAWFPDAAATTRSAAVVIGAAAPDLASLSLAPLGTRRELAEGFAILSVLVASWSASAAGDRVWVVRAAAGSIVLIALVSLLHTVLDVRQPFGFLRAPHWNPAFIGPILNQNMLGGVLAAGAPLALACGVDSERREVRLPWLAAAAGLALMTSFCGSRGAIMSLGVGVIAFAALWARNAKVAPSRTRVAMLLGTGLVVITSVTAFALVADPMIAETRQGLPKLEMFRRSLDLVPGAPWSGVGRGAYAVAFVRAHGGLERPEHPENMVVEWIVELGLPLAIVLIAALAVSLVRAVRGARSPAQIGAIAATGSLVAHDQFDFALEMVGIAVVGAAILGAAVAPSNGSAPSSPTPTGPSADVKLAPAVLGVLGLVVSLFIAGPTIELAVPRLRDEMVDAIRTQDWGRVDALSASAIRAHPSEPVFPLLAGHASLLQDREDTLNWLSRAMLLAPWWYEPHHLTARWLARHGAVEQAWLEVREVRRIEPAMGPRVACAVASRPGATASALRVLAEDRELLDAIVRCTPAEGGAVIDAALATAGHAGALLRQARAAIAGGRGADALEILARVEEDDDAALLVRADALRLTGHHSAAVAALERRPRGDRSRPIVVRLARAQADAGDEDAMRATLEDLLALGDGSPGELASQRLLLAELEAALGHEALAMRALRDAHDAEPDGPALQRILTLATRTGDRARERLARAELCRREGPHSAHCASGREPLAAPGQPLTGP